MVKWMLVLYFAGLAGSGAPPVATSIGPFDQRDGCFAVGALAQKDGWKGWCYPIGDVPLKKTEAPAPDKKAPAADKKKP